MKCEWRTITSNLKHLAEAPPPADLDGYPELDLLSRSLSFSSPSLRVSTRIEAYSCKAIKSERRLFKTLEHDMLTDLTLSTSISPPEHHSALLDSAFGRLDNKGSRKTLWLLIATLNLAFPDHDFSRVSADEFDKAESARSVLSGLSSALSHLRSSGPDASYNRSFASIQPDSPHGIPPFLPPGMMGIAPLGASRSKGRLRADSRSRPSPANSKRKSPSAKPHTELFGENRVNTDLAADDTFGGLGGDDIPANSLIRRVLDPIIDLQDCEAYSYTPDIDSDPHAHPSDDEYEDVADGEEGGEETGMVRSASDAGIHAPADEEDSYMAAADSGMEEGPSSYKLASSWSLTEKEHKQRNAGSRQGRKDSNVRLHQATYSTNLHDDDEESMSANAYENDFDGMDGFMSEEDDRMRRHAQDDEDDIDETGGLLWSSNHFFYNRKMRRIVFVSCWGRKVGNAPLALLQQSHKINPFLQVQKGSPFARKDRVPTLPQSLPARTDLFWSASITTSNPPALSTAEVINSQDAASVFSTMPVATPPHAGLERGTSLVASQTRRGSMRPLLGQSGAASGFVSRPPSVDPPLGVFSADSTVFPNTTASRKHYTTPPASVPSTPIAETLSRLVSPAPSAAGSPGLGNAPPTSSTASHAAAHRRQKRRASSHGTPGSATRSERRRRTAVVTPARKIA
ncbi:hypothetical protein EMMF5_001266 [Cystobasidiomycetes sp. EMM_F5]